MEEGISVGGTLTSDANKRQQQKFSSANSSTQVQGAKLNSDPADWLEATKLSTAVIDSLIDVTFDTLGGVARLRRKRL